MVHSIKEASVDIGNAVNGIPAATAPTPFNTTLLLQTLSEIVVFTGPMWFITNADRTEEDIKILTKRNPWLMRMTYGFVVVLGLVFRVLECSNIVLFEHLLPHYIYPVFISVVVLSIAAKLDKPMLKHWPRPHSITYMMVLNTVFVWFVPWSTDIVSIFWTRLTPSLEHHTRLSMLRDAMLLKNTNVSATATAAAAASAWSPSSSMDDSSLNDFYSESSSVFQKNGFLINLMWSVCVVLLTIWIRFYIEPSTMPSMSIAVSFGFSLFKSYLTTLLFLAVKPLDLEFYFLVLFQCFFKIILGLGLKNYIYDRFCSSAKWKRSFDTMAQKKINRAMKTNFTIVTPLCTKCSMIAIVLIEYMQVAAYEQEAAAQGLSRDTLQWQPAFTGGFHQLERMSMAAGFFVQVAFHLISSEIVESIIARRINQLKRKLSTITAIKKGMSGGHKGNTKLIQNMKKASMESGGGGGGGEAVELRPTGLSFVSKVGRNSLFKHSSHDSSALSQKKSSLFNAGLGAHELGRCCCCYCFFTVAVVFVLFQN